MEAIYLDGFERLLGYRFASLDDAVARLEAFKGLDLARLTLALSRLKDLPTSPNRRVLLEYGKRLVDQVVAAGDPAGLEEFLDPARTRYVLLREYAIQKAAQMGPAPTGVWSRVLRVSLAAETDPTVLREGLTILERTGFAKEPVEAARIAAALAQRLQRYGPDAADGQDALADRVRMAKLVGSLRSRPHELDLLLATGERLETEVISQLVRALGGIRGIPAEDVLAFYRLSSTDPQRDRAIRIAVVDALGRPGLSAEGADGAAEAAAAALRELLTGEGGARLGRATDGDVRQHAIRSLGSHGSPETAAVLGALVLADDEKEAEVAVVVLRKTATSNPARGPCAGRAGWKRRARPGAPHQGAAGAGGVARGRGGVAGHRRRGRAHRPDVRTGGRARRGAARGRSDLRHPRGSPGPPAGVRLVGGGAGRGPGLRAPDPGARRRAIGGRRGP